MQLRHPVCISLAPCSSRLINCCEPLSRVVVTYCNLGKYAKHWAWLPPSGARLHKQTDLPDASGTGSLSGRPSFSQIHQLHCLP